MSQIASSHFLPDAVSAFQGLEASETPHPTIQIDVDRYQRMIDDPRLTAEQREQVVLTIWSLLMAMVDFGLVLGTQPHESELERKS